MNSIELREHILATGTDAPTETGMHILAPATIQRGDPRVLLVEVITYYGQLALTGPMSLIPGKYQKV